MFEGRKEFMIRRVGSVEFFQPSLTRLFLYLSNDVRDIDDTIAQSSGFYQILIIPYIRLLSMQR